MHDEWTPQPGDEDLLRQLDAQDDHPHHPYDELGLSPELTAAAIAEDNARADLLMEEIRAGRLTPPPSGASQVDFDELARRSEADKRALAQNGWREIARREARTFGAPKQTTLLHLRASRATLLVRTFFPASHAGGRGPLQAGRRRRRYAPLSRHGARRAPPDDPDLARPAGVTP